MSAIAALILLCCCICICKYCCYRKKKQKDDKKGLKSAVDLKSVQMLGNAYKEKVRLFGVWQICILFLEQWFCRVCSVCWVKYRVVFLAHINTSTSTACDD